MSPHTQFYPERKTEQVTIALSSADLYEAALNLLDLFNEHIESPVQLPVSESNNCTQCTARERYSLSGKKD